MCASQSPGSVTTNFFSPWLSLSQSSSSPSSSQLDESLKGLTKQVELFRRHSRKLSQVAAYAAQSSTDSKRE